MLLIMGSFRFPPENMQAARLAIATMLTASRAEEGCMLYAFAEDVLDPGLIRVSELWSDHDALARHAATGHMAQWRAAGAGLGISGRDISLYEVGDPRAI